MAREDSQKLIHIHSSVITEGVPKAPNEGVLAKGEIAVNYNNEQPSLFIEKQDGTIAQFTDKSYIDGALAGIEGAVVDSAMTDDSHNAVENCVIKEYVDSGMTVLDEKIAELEEKIDIDGNDIPKLMWTGELPTSKAEGNIKGAVKWVSKTQEFDCYGTLKVQGNSTTVYNKKNFTLTFYSDAECNTKSKKNFKGWGGQSKYVIKANWIDISHARNVVGARIWSKMMSTRETYDSYPEALRTSPNNGVVDGFPVKFYVNGIYWGRYSFNIPKDGWMSNMDKNNDEEVILCGEDYTHGCFHALPVINESDWTDELHSAVPAGILSSWTAAVNFVMTSSDIEFYAALDTHFDVPSLIDYYIFGVVVCHLDGFGKNQMYMKYADSKYIAQVYDMDSTQGLWWNGQSFVSPQYAREQFQDYAEPTGGGGNLLYIKLARVFSDEIAARWLELKDTVLSVNNLVLEYEKWCEICPKELVEEDYNATTGRGNFQSMPQVTTNNIGQIRNYIADRRAYCETKLAAQEKYFNIELTQTNALPGTVVGISISTNLASSDATINVTGRAVFDSTAMTITINNNAQGGDMIQITATSDYDSTYTASTILNVVTELQEIVLWSGKTADGTAFSRTLTNGVGEDINFAAGDYIEAHLDFSNEASVNAELIGFGTNISEYNNTMHLNNQQLPSSNTWVLFKTWAQTDVGNGSIQTGGNYGANFYVRYKNDGIYASSDGETYTMLDHGSLSNIFNALWASFTGSSTVQIGSVQGTHSNGTYYDYIKVVKTEAPAHYYTFSLTALDDSTLPVSQGEAGSRFGIMVSTDLPTTGSTFQVDGPATFDSVGLVLTIDSTATTNSTVTLTATSTEDDSYSHYETITVVHVERYYTLSSNKSTGEAGDTIVVSLSTNLSSSASTFNVSGPATFDAENMTLTIADSAETGSVITLTATSTADANYDDTLNISVFETIFNYSISASTNQAEKNQVVYIALDTDLPSSASTFNVSGPATFDAENMALTISGEAGSGATVVLTATSTYRSKYSASTAVSIIRHVYTYAISAPLGTAAPGDDIIISLVTDLSSTASTFVVTGAATFDAETMTLSIASSAASDSTITLTATSTEDSDYTSSISIDVEESTPSEIVLISDTTSDGTSKVVTFTNGPAGDANFAGGDYLEYKVNMTNDIRAGEVLGFGPNISIYNNCVHFGSDNIGNTWAYWRTWVDAGGTISGSMNLGSKIVTIQYKSDGIYYSTDGINFTKVTLTNAYQAAYEGWWESLIKTSSTLQVGWNYNTHPNGTYYDYVKVVKNSTPTYNYEIEASRATAIPGESITITVDTNLSSTATTFNVTGPATINASTGVLTINNDAAANSAVIVNATSSVKPSYTATTSITVEAPSYALSIEKTGATPNESILITVSTNLASTASTFNVTGPATLDTSTMMLTIDSTAVTDTVITIEATSTVNSNYTASTTVTITESSETILWSNITLNSTPISRTLTNGVGGDIDFANGDYIEAKFNTTNETIGNARIFSFGHPIEAYNNTFNIEKQMNGNSWVVFMGWFDMSVRVGFNPGYEFYVRFTKDGVFYSSDGVTYTEAVLDDNPPTGAGTPYYRSWYADAVAASTIEIGHKYNNMPSGSVWKYVKIVKAPQE